MSDEHMATAREVTRDWTPQTTLADSRRDIANALAAAEERGRLRGVEEAAKIVEEYGAPIVNVQSVAARIRSLTLRDSRYALRDELRARVEEKA